MRKYISDGRLKRNIKSLIGFYSIVSFLLVFNLLSSCKQQEEKVEATTELTKEELGRQLFFDPRLSSDNTISCASCHIPEKAFTDGKEVAIGVGGRKGFRNVPTLINVGNMHVFMFDGVVPTLEMQAIVPIQDTNEMNIRMHDLILKLRKIESYNRAAKELFNREFDAFVLTRSLAAFQRTIKSTGSAFDDYLKGDENAITPSAMRGWKVFSEELYCTKCHPAPDFSIHQTKNNGYMGDTLSDQGRYRATGIDSDKNCFKVPTLRNIDLTGPYMHDGQFKTLDEILNYYSSNKRHTNVDPTIKNFNLDSNMREDLKAFLKSLTDSIYAQ